MPEDKTPEPGASEQRPKGEWIYQYGGLRVVSELHLPEWEPFVVAPWPGVAAALPDVRIVFGQLDHAGPEPLISQTEYAFRVPGVGAFQIRNGCEIVVSPEDSVRKRKLRPWVLGSGWGALCYQRGGLVAHASAVQVGEAAVLFCARSGGGKSTLAAKLGTRGYALVSDDLCRIEIPAQGAPTVYPAAPRLKLWQDALSNLGLNTERMEPDHLREGKFHLSAVACGLVNRLPLGAIYLLEWGEPGIRRLSGLTAFRHFLAAGTWRPKLLEAMGLISGHAQRCMDVVQRVPVWEFKRPRDLPATEESVTRLTGHWEASGVS